MRGIIPGTSLLDRSVPVSLHCAPDKISFRLASYGYIGVKIGVLLDFL
jgi:hypothetical protein